MTKQTIPILFILLGLISSIIACSPVAEERVHEPTDDIVKDATIPDTIDVKNDVDTTNDDLQPKQEENMKQNQESAPPLLKAEVIEVIDGDTIVIRLENGQEERTRLIGVDTPESTREIEPFGKEATAFTTKSLTGRIVYIESDVSERDRFGRLLAYVWLSKPTDNSEAEVRAKMFNADLLLQGYASIMTIQPNVKYSDIFLIFEREAREALIGLWTVLPVQEATDVFIEHVDLRTDTVTIRNNSSSPVDVSGWTLVSERGNQRFTFLTNTIIQPNDTIKIVSGPDATAVENKILWTKSNIWNNDGDPAVLLDALGKEVSRN